MDNPGTTPDSIAPGGELGGRVCPSCRYDLTGLTMAEVGITCPECGAYYATPSALSIQGRIGWLRKMLALAAPWPISVTFAIIGNMSGASDASPCLVLLSPIASLYIAVILEDGFAPIAGLSMGARILTVLVLWAMVNGFAVLLLILLAFVA